MFFPIIKNIYSLHTEKSKAKNKRGGVAIKSVGNNKKHQNSTDQPGVSKISPLLEAEGKIPQLSEKSYYSYFLTRES